MFKKAVVLGGQQRVYKRLWQIFIAGGDSFLLTKLANELAISTQYSKRSL